MIDKKICEEKKHVIPEEYLILHKSMRSFFDAKTSGSDVSGSNVLLFVILDKCEMTQAQLSKKSRFDKARLNRVVVDMINKGYFEIEQGKAKNNKLTLTPKGKLFAEQCKVYLKEYIAALTQGISEAELKRTKETLYKLAQNAKKMKEEMSKQGDKK